MKPLTFYRDHEQANIEDYSNSISSVCETLKSCLKYVGLYVDKHFLHRIYCFILCVILFADFARFITIFYTFPGIYDRFIGACALLMFHILVCFNLIVFLYSLRKHLKTFCTTLERYQIRYGLHSNPYIIKKRIKRIVVCMVIFGSFANIGISLLMVLYPASEKGLLLNSYSPFQTLPPLILNIAIFLLNIVKSFAGMQLQIQMLFYCFVCYIIGSEYKRISRRITDLAEDMRNDHALDNVSEFENIRKQHESVTHVLSACNSILKHFVFSAYAACIPTICFIIYGLIKDALPQEDMAAFLEAITFTILILVIVTSAGSMINTQVR